MLIGLFLIITAWTVPGLPLWYSVITTVWGALHMFWRFINIVGEAENL